MKFTRNTIIYFILLTFCCALYRIIPGKPWGFTPQYAMAIFGGAVFSKQKDKAFLLPLASMLLSDLLFQILYKNGMSAIPGFYDGQWLNYILLMSLTFVGFGIRKINVLNIGIASLIAPTAYYLMSNFSVWLTTSMYPKTGAGLLQCYVAGWPFYYPGALISTLLFSGLFFGIYYLLDIRKMQNRNVHVA